jgi:DNA polymerase III delta subunit
MPYLLLGSDEYSKEQFVQALVKELEAETAVFNSEDQLPNLDELLQNDLFSKAKIFIFKGILPKYLTEIKAGQQNKNKVVVLLGSLDKRKKENKDLLNNPNIEIKEFILPHGRELDIWIQKQVALYGGKISLNAVNLLSVYLGRDNGKEVRVGGKIIEVVEVFNLYQVNSEILKLIAYTQNREITEQDVKDLVVENGEVEVFDLTNAIADGQKQKSIELMNRFLKEQSGAEEKTSLILLNSLLAEQFRNVAMVQSFFADKQETEENILKITGWKPGRLFVMKKIASKFEPKKILDTLNKLESLDQEIKSSQIPARVIMDLIITQLFV